jgi:hypothetical protein
MGYLLCHNSGDFMSKEGGLLATGEDSSEKALGPWFCDQQRDCGPKLVL